MWSSYNRGKEKEKRKVRIDFSSRQTPHLRFQKGCQSNCFANILINIVKAFKHAHFLDLAEILSFSSKEVNDNPYSSLTFFIQIELRIRTFDKPLLAESDRVDSIIRTIISTFKKRFSAIGLPFQLQVLPKERLDTILSTIQDPGIFRFIFSVVYFFSCRRMRRL